MISLSTYADDDLNYKTGWCSPLSNVGSRHVSDGSELMKPALYLKVIRSSRAAAAGPIGPIKPFKRRRSQQSPAVVSLSTLPAD